jgi:hypothetical protein
VKIPVMPQPTVPSISSNCPHLQSGLLSWGNVATWPNKAKPSFGSDVILPGNVSILLKGTDLSSTGPFPHYSATIKDSTVMPTPTAVHGYFSSITIPKGTRLIIDDSPLVLGIHRILVYGQLIIGSSSCRVKNKIQFIFDGIDQSELPVQESKGLLVFGEGGISGGTKNGRLELHGKEVYPWIRLARTAYPFDTILSLQEPATNWEVGQVIVITTTIWKTLDRDENEVRIIKSISDTKKEIEIDRPLEHFHYGGIEFQGEVALLSRAIEFYGERSYHSDVKWGGHIMIAHGGEGKIAGTATIRMGQTNQLARYPFHFHVLASAPNSSITDSVIVESFYRCVVVHGTDNTLISRNVAFRARGHCYYIEDGVEENNTFSYNLGAQISTIYKSAGGWEQFGEIYTESDELRNPADTSAGSFYITNAHNSFIGNVAVGGWTGFAFPNLPRPINLHRNLDYSSTLRNPQNRNLIVFDGNTARSTASVYYESGGIYVGGYLVHLEDGRLYYRSGRQARTTYDDNGNIAWMEFTNTLTAHTFRGIAHWGDQVEVRHFECHDSVKGLTLFGEALAYDVIINARTENSQLVDLELPARTGFQYYDTWVKTLLVEITFENFNAALGDMIIFGMTHSDTWKPQGINAARSIHFINCSRETRFQINNVATGSSWMYNIIDYDGSSVDWKEPVIIGSHPSWWNYDDRCVKDIDWDLWICPKKNFSIASLEIIMPNITRNDSEVERWESHRHMGYMSLLQRGPKKTRLPLTKNPQTTGITNSIWYMELFGGSPRHIEIDTIQIPMNHFLVLAIPYTAKTSFRVAAYQKWWWTANGPRTLIIPQAHSISELLQPEQLKDKKDYICPDSWNPPSTTYQDNICQTGGIGPLWYFNGSILFIRMVDLTNYIPAYQNTPDFKYAREGAELNTIDLLFRWYIDANCEDQCDGNAYRHAKTCYYPGVEQLETTTIEIPPPNYRCQLWKDTKIPTRMPTRKPSLKPTRRPSPSPSITLKPSTRRPSASPSLTSAPSVVPTLRPSTAVSSTSPTFRPTRTPTRKPTLNLSAVPSRSPSLFKSIAPTRRPSTKPTISTNSPTRIPSTVPSGIPTISPTPIPSKTPTKMPVVSPSKSPSKSPNSVPTKKPVSSRVPTRSPSKSPTSKKLSFSLRGMKEEQNK